MLGNHYRFLGTCFALVIFSVSGLAWGQESISLNEWIPKQAPYTFLVNEKGPTEAISQKLYSLKKSYIGRSISQCLKESESQLWKNESIYPWILRVRLQCVLYLKDSTQKDQEVESGIELVRGLTGPLRNQPFSELLGSVFQRGLLYQARRAHESIDWPRLEKSLEQLQVNSDFLSDGDKALHSYLMAELALFKNEKNKAIEEYKVAYRLRPGRRIRRKILTRLSELLEKKQVLVFNQEPSLKSDKGSGTSNNVVNYVKKVRSHDGRWVYSQPSRFKELEDLSIDSMVDLVGSLFSRGYYFEVSAILDPFLQLPRIKSLDISENKVKLIEMKARSDHFQGSYEKAIIDYDLLIASSNSKESLDEYLFKKGLLYTLSGQREKAIEALREYQSRVGDGIYELSSLYWLFRNYVHLKNEKQAEVIKQQILKKFPLTYYGLMVRLDEKQANKPIAIEYTDNSVLSFNLPLNELQKNYLNQFKILVAGGWYKEARAIIENLGLGSSQNERLFKSVLNMNAAETRESIREYNDLIYENPKLISWPLLKMVFPIYYMDEIKQWSQKHNMNPFLVAGLIRQESAFETDAKSVAGARGLMQMIRPTAREVARVLKVPQSGLYKRLYEPEFNVRFGTYYLKRVIRGNKGNVPLALASYNVGMGNMYKWFRSREAYRDLRSQVGVDMDSELWVEELAWGETRFYVLAVLRNYLIYNWLYGDLSLDTLNQMIDRP